MSANVTRIWQASVRRRVRNGALALACLALVFYFGFILLLVLHSHR